MDQVRKFLLTTSFSWKRGLSLGLGTTGMPQAAQNRGAEEGHFQQRGTSFAANESSCLKVQQVRGKQ